MASWLIHCIDCKHVTNPGTVDNLADHCDELGWFFCSACNGRGYIKKEKKLQEGWTYKYFLLGILGGIRNDAKDPDETYFPFAFVLSDQEEKGNPDMSIKKVQCDYYKDTRRTGGKDGRLKPGSGPGGPPIFFVEQMFALVKQLGLLTGHKVYIEPVE